MQLREAAGVLSSHMCLRLGWQLPSHAPCLPTSACWASQWHGWWWLHLAGLRWIDCWRSIFGGAKGAGLLHPCAAPMQPGLHSGGAHPSSGPLPSGASTQRPSRSGQLP